MPENDNRQSLPLEKKQRRNSCFKKQSFCGLKSIGSNPLKALKHSREAGQLALTEAKNTVEKSYKQIQKITHIDKCSSSLLQTSDEDDDDSDTDGSTSEERTKSIVDDLSGAPNTQK